MRNSEGALRTFVKSSDPLPGKPALTARLRLTPDKLLGYIFFYKRIGISEISKWDILFGAKRLYNQIGKCSSNSSYSFSRRVSAKEAYLHENFKNIIFDVALILLDERVTVLPICLPNKCRNDFQRWETILLILNGFSA